MTPAQRRAARIAAGLEAARRYDEQSPLPRVERAPTPGAVKGFVAHRCHYCHRPYAVEPSCTCGD